MDLETIKNIYGARTGTAETLSLEKFLDIFNKFTSLNRKLRKPFSIDLKTGHYNLDMIYIFFPGFYNIEQEITDEENVILNQLNDMYVNLVMVNTTLWPPIEIVIRND